MLERAALKHGSRVTPFTSGTAGALSGRLRVPGDKSLSHRALILGALAVGRTRLRLELQAERIRSLVETPGRLHQSLAEASFDAWIKYYQRDENAPNSQVSYYEKGQLVAMLLDLELRQ